MENLLTEKQQNILKVADACSNLYGVYSMTQLIKVYNEFNKDKITKDEVYHLCDIDEHEDLCETIFYTDCLAHKSIGDDDIDKIIKAQRGSNFYIPKTYKELLSYKNRLYIEPNKAYEEFITFLKENMITSLKKKEAHDVIDLTLPASYKIGLPLEMTLFIFAEYGVTFNHNVFGELASSYDKVGATIRMWTRKGLTAKELAAYQKVKEKTKIS